MWLITLGSDSMESFEDWRFFLLHLWDQLYALITNQSMKAELKRVCIYLNLHLHLFHKLGFVRLSLQILIALKEFVSMLPTEIFQSWQTCLLHIMWYLTHVKHAKGYLSKWRCKCWEVLGHWKPCLQVCQGNVISHLSYFFVDVWAGVRDFDMPETKTWFESILG